MPSPDVLPTSISFDHRVAVTPRHEGSSFKHAQSIATAPTTGNSWVTSSSSAVINPRRMEVGGSPPLMSGGYVATVTSGPTFGNLFPPGGVAIPTPLAARQIFMHSNVPKRRRSPIAPEIAKSATYAETGEVFIPPPAEEAVVNRSRANSPQCMSPSMVIEGGQMAWHSPPNTPVYLVGGQASPPPRRLTATELSFLKHGVHSPPTASVDESSLWHVQTQNISQFIVSTCEEEEEVPFHLRSPYAATNPSVHVVPCGVKSLVFCPYKSLKLTLSQPEWDLGNLQADRLLVLELMHGTETVRLSVDREEASSDSHLCSIQMPLCHRSVLRCVVKRGDEVIGRVDIDMFKMLASRVKSISGSLPVGLTLMSPRLRLQALIELQHEDLAKSPEVDDAQVKAQEAISRLELAEECKEVDSDTEPVDDDVSSATEELVDLSNKSVLFTSGQLVDSSTGKVKQFSSIMVYSGETPVAQFVDSRIERVILPLTNQKIKPPLRIELLDKEGQVMGSFNATIQDSNQITAAIPTGGTSSNLVYHYSLELEEVPPLNAQPTRASLLGTLLEDDDDRQEDEEEEEATVELARESATEDEVEVCDEDPEEVVRPVFNPEDMQESDDAKRSEGSSSGSSVVRKKAHRQLQEEIRDAPQQKTLRRLRTEIAQQPVVRQMQKVRKELLQRSKSSEINSSSKSKGKELDEQTRKMIARQAFIRRKQRAKSAENKKKKEESSGGSRRKRRPAASYSKSSVG